MPRRGPRRHLPSAPGPGGAVSVRPSSRPSCGSTASSPSPPSPSSSSSCSRRGSRRFAPSPRRTSSSRRSSTSTTSPRRCGCGSRSARTPSTRSCRSFSAASSWPCRPPPPPHSSAWRPGVSARRSARPRGQPLGDDHAGRHPRGGLGSRRRDSPGDGPGARRDDDRLDGDRQRRTGHPQPVRQRADHDGDDRRRAGLRAAGRRAVPRPLPGRSAAVHPDIYHQPGGRAVRRPDAQEAGAVKRRFVETIALALLRGTALAVLLATVLLLGSIVRGGIGVINWEFLATEPTQGMTHGGIFPAIFGTVCITLLMIVMALPLGVCAAIYMVEYAGNSALARVIRASVNNLAGVPSIVFGLFGVGFFILFLGRSIDRVRGSGLLFGQPAMLWAAATLAVLVLPVKIGRASCR